MIKYPKKLFEKTHCFLNVHNTSTLQSNNLHFNALKSHEIKEFSDSQRKDHFSLVPKIL